MNRRRLVASAAGVAASSVLIHPATAQEASPETGWTFLDDRGVTVSLPAMPTRILADTGAGLALWSFGIKPVGLIGYAGNYDIPEELADVPFLDLSAGELDMEQVIAIAPDLSVSQAWSTNNPHDFGGAAETSWPGFTDVAPTLGILAVQTPVNEAIDRFAELAAALGANLDDEAIAADRVAFEEASEAVRTATAANPGLTVMAISTNPDVVWIGNPTVASDLVYFASLGVDLKVPEAPQEAMDGLFQEISWEELGQYPVDLYLNDVRPYGLTDEELLAQPVFAIMPGANQRTGWWVEYVPSYAALTPILQSLAEGVSSAEVVTG